MSYHAMQLEQLREIAQDEGRSRNLSRADVVAIEWAIESYTPVAEELIKLDDDLAAARAEVDRLRKEIREAVRVESTMAASEAVTLARVLSILRAALGTTPPGGGS